MVVTRRSERGLGRSECCGWLLSATPAAHTCITIVCGCRGREL
jgi:hypothetical protein